MRTFYFIFFSIIWLPFSGCRETQRQTGIITLTEKKLFKLLAEREYFELRRVLVERQDSIDENKKFFFTAFVENAFNQNKKSSEIVDQLLRDSIEELNDTLKAELLILQRDNYIKIFDYAKAAQMGRQVLDYKNVFDEKRWHDIENLQRIYEGLSSTPGQQVEPIGKNIEWKRDKVGLMNVPVKTKSSSSYFVFDTRASISTIMRKYAAKFKLRMLDVWYKESSGITGKTFDAQLAVADSLYVGDLLLRHVVFQVLPDSILSFPSIEYEISGLIGFPVIKELRELHIYQNGLMTISAGTRNNLLQNLAFDEATTVVSLRTPKDTLSFHFDSGANSSHLYANYFKRFESEVKSNAKFDSVQIGGAGGMDKIDVYILPVFELHAGNRMAKFRDMHVSTRPPYANQKYNGNLGQDLISQFDELILNFESMYVEFK